MDDLFTAQVETSLEDDLADIEPGCIAIRDQVTGGAPLTPHLQISGGSIGQCDEAVD
jgi:hypothetical protein